MVIESYTRFNLRLLLVPWFFASSCSRLCSLSGGLRLRKKRLEQQGVSPQRVLEEAKALAEKQRKVLEEVGPKQAEQESSQDWGR